MSFTAHDMIRIAPLGPRLAAARIDARRGPDVELDIIWPELPVGDERDWANGLIGMCVDIGRAVDGIYEDATNPYGPRFAYQEWAVRKLGPDLPALLRRAAVQALEADWAEIEGMISRSTDIVRNARAREKIEIERAKLQEQLAKPLPVVGATA